MTTDTGTPAAQWKVSARTRGEVLIAEAGAEDLRLLLLGIPPDFTPPEIEGWLHDVAGVARETALADPSPMPIPGLLHHALTGLLFSHAELWDRSGDHAQCSMALVETGGEIGFGWVGAAEVSVALDRAAIEVGWVRVRGERGHEARAWSIETGHTVELRVMWPQGAPAVVVEATWAPRASAPGPVEDSVALDASAVTPLGDGAQDVGEVSEPEGAEAIGVAPETSDREGPAEPEPASATASASTTEPASTTASEPAGAIGAGATPSSGVARWLQRNFSWMGARRPARAEPLPRGGGVVAAPTLDRPPAFGPVESEALPRGFDPLHEPASTRAAEPPTEGAPASAAETRPEPSHEMIPPTPEPPSLTARTVSLQGETRDATIGSEEPSGAPPDPRAIALPPAAPPPWLDPRALRPVPSEEAQQGSPRLLQPLRPRWERDLPVREAPADPHVIPALSAPASDAPSVALPGTDRSIAASESALEPAPGAPARTAPRPAPIHPARTSTWPSADQLERAARPGWLRVWPWVAALVALLFGIGWLLGALQSPAPGAGRPGRLAALLRTMGVGGPHFDLEVDSRPPGAWIAVDGHNLSLRTPTTLDLPAGEHEVSLSFAGLGGSSFRVLGTRNEKVRLAPPLWGTLEVVSPDLDAVIAVSVDGEARGFAPLRLDSIAPGAHEIRFSGSGMASWGQTVQIRVHEEKQVLTRPLQSPATGVIQVRATSSGEGGTVPIDGARLWVDGAAHGTVPATLELPRGPHSLRVVYRSEEAPVQVIDLPGGNQRFATFDFGLNAEFPRLVLNAPERIPLDHPVVVSAALANAAADDVREMWLHVRAPDGLWKRYPMTVLDATGGAVGTVVFPVANLNQAGKAPYYLSALTAQGDEYFTEMQAASAELSPR